jgi:galactose mutarotase-like enzyme
MHHSLTNENNELTFSENGAELISWKYDKAELIWQAEPGIWPRHSPILFPIVGQLKNLIYFLHGRKYKMPRHGFARDMKWSLKKKNEKQICFELSSNEETFKTYPYEFDIVSSYELQNDQLIHKIEIRNKSKETMFFGLGAHPAFNLSGESGEYVLLCGEKETYVRNELTNGLISTSHENLPDKIEINEKTFEKDALVFLNQSIKSLRLFRKKPDIIIEVSGEKIPFWGIWSVPGCRKFVCLEPWWSHTDFMDADEELSLKKQLKCLLPQKTECFAYQIKLLNPI